MNDLQMMGAVATSLKPAIDLADTVLKLVGSGKGRKEALELYGQIVAAQKGALAAQETQATLIKDKEALEAELAKFEEWDRTKTRYELKIIGHGAFVYTVKESERGSEPIHSICPNCYEQRRRSILQPSEIHRPTGVQKFHCMACEKVIAAKMANPQQVISPGGSSGWT